MKKSILIIFGMLFLSFSLKSPAQESKELFSLHPKFGLGPVFHMSDFNYLNSQVNCGEFISGFGLGIFPALGFELPVSNSLYLDLNLGYFSNTADFSRDNVNNAYDSDAQKSILVNTKNEIEAKLGFFTINPGIRAKVLEDFINGPLVLFGSIGLNIPITKTFTQTESIESPSNAFFINSGKRLRTRELLSGDIENVSSVVISVNAGIENQLKLSENLAFTQQIAFDYSFNDIVSHSQWKYFDIKAGIGLRYSFIEAPKKETPPPPPPPVIEEPVKETPKPILVYKQGGTENNILSTGNELLATQTLLNVVFFDNNSAEIPSSYFVKQQNIPELNLLNPIKAHSYSLLRIAELIKTKPNSKLILEGATAGEANEPLGIALAQNRAENVKNALVNLGVNPKQIETKWSLTPKNPTNQEYKEGIEENRRVDIVLKNALLQEYVSKQNYAELSGTIDYSVSLENMPNQSAQVYFDFLDTTLTINKSGNYKLNYKKRIDDKASKIDIASRVAAGGLIADDVTSIDLSSTKKRVVELDYSKFKAILRFDYNSSKLSEENKELLTQLIDILPENSTIKILGSADALGSEQGNIKLSSDRAKVTEDFIRSLNRNINITTGNNTEKFDENSPIGRFLNRSIIITIEK